MRFDEDRQRFEKIERLKASNSGDKQVPTANPSGAEVLMVIGTNKRGQRNQGITSKEACWYKHKNDF